jgi:membrane protein implicated in regulation of membrane protease activity
METLPFQLMVWVGIAVVLAIVELFTVGFFIVFFACGALVAAATALLTDSIAVQIIVFVVTSGLLVFFARPLIKRSLGVGDRLMKQSNVDALIGQKVLVIDPVTRYQGRVKMLHTGEVWSAYLDNAQDEQTLESGAEGLVSAVNGAKLVIKPKE